MSLTINERQDGEIGLMLIPHTLERTNLKELGQGSTVNIEYDQMVRVIVDRFDEIASERFKNG